MTHSAIVVVFALVAIAVPILAAPEGDRITTMPHYSGSVPFKQYSGYLNVKAGAGGHNPKGNMKLFYWFVESQNNPTTDPVTLWLNGGPGCSSLDGFFYEHGPFKFDRTHPGDTTPNTTLHANPFSWNRVSNVLYMEAPAGVGLSYSDNSLDYVTNDNQTALDNYRALVSFFSDKFPEYQKNDFWVTGESYGGIYVPTLSYTIHEMNKNSSNLQINLKGMMVGNGVTDEQFDAHSFNQFAFAHGLYSPNLHRELKEKHCLNSNSVSCIRLLREMYKQIGNVNIYDIYQPCYSGPDFEKYNYSPLRWLAGKQPENNNVGEQVPCINSYAATVYLNDPAVRQAIHAESVQQIGNWAICSSKIHYTKIFQSVLWAYDVIAKHYRVLVYSGDTDGAVPYLGTVASMYEFENHTAPTVDWRPWTTNNQVSGYATVWPDLTLTTVKGSGHMVPQYKPPQAFEMFARFLNGTFPHFN